MVTQDLTGQSGTGCAERQCAVTLAFPWDIDGPDGLGSIGGQVLVVVDGPRKSSTLCKWRWPCKQMHSTGQQQSPQRRGQLKGRRLRGLAAGAAGSEKSLRLAQVVFLASATALEKCAGVRFCIVTHSVLGRYNQQTWQVGLGWLVVPLTWRMCWREKRGRCH